MKNPAKSARRLATLLAAACVGQASAAVMSDELHAALQGKAPTELVPVIIGFADRVDPAQYRGLHRHERRATLVRAMRDKSERSHAEVSPELEARGTRNLRKLWVSNSLAAEVPAGQIPALAALPGVESIRTDAVLPAPTFSIAPAAAPQWNLSAIGAPQLWAQGFDGAGIVVASLDTGVDYRHPDLQARWRGGGNSWFDPYGRHALPYDALGHGTQTMGILVGGAASGSAIGVAPGAQWIAAKIFDDNGSATYSAIHAGFQWLLDPDGDPATDDAPDVVNNSWGLTAIGGCSLEFNTDIEMLRAAGIKVAFAGGNYGPSASTSISPANNGGGLGIGAVDAADQIASFSSRGPSACDGSYFPKLTAPGANVTTATLSGGGNANYATVSGTSFAAPHVAGALALLTQAFPAATVADLEGALKNTAHDLGTVGNDNSYGYGMIDVAAAYAQLAAAPPAPPANQTPVAVDDSASTRRGQSVAIRVIANDHDPDGSLAPASVKIVAAPKSGSAVVNADGSVTYTPKGTFRGTDSFGYTVKDMLGAASNKAAVTVKVSR